MLNCYYQPSTINSQDPGTHSNVLWGTCNKKDSIYLMLPSFPADQDLKKSFPLIYQATFLAAEEEIPFTSIHWSKTYHAGVDETQAIPADCPGVTFADRVMENIQKYQWGKLAYWFICMEGKNDQFYYEVNQTREVVDDLLASVNRETSTVFLDVALEVHLADGYASLPGRFDNLHFGMAEDIWGTTWEEFRQGWPHYEPDVWAGNAYIAGFRCNFSTHPVTTNQIHYARVYTSDKYPFNTSSDLLLLASQILKMQGPNEIPEPMRRCCLLFSEAQTAGFPTDVCFEARVPAHKAEFVYSSELSPRDLSHLIYAVPLEVVW